MVICINDAITLKYEEQIYDINEIRNKLNDRNKVEMQQNVVM